MTTDIEQKTAPEMSGEQVAAFASLQAKAEGQHVPGDPVTEDEQEAPQVPLAAQISGMLEMVVGVVAPMFPSLKAIYTPEAIEQVGVAMQPLCEKHSWLQDGVAGKYGEELLALFVVGPLAYATYAGISSDIASRKPAKKVEQLARAETAPRVDVPATGGDSDRLTVTAGKVIPA